MWWVGVAGVLASFVVGSLNPAVALARLKGADLHGSGSGNPGATNAGRVLGAGWGVLVGVLDVAKGFLPPWVAEQAGWSQPWVLACGLAAVTGHMFSPFLRGKGGKGVATALGAMLAVQPWYAAVALLVVALALPVVRRVGLASALAAGVLVLVGLADLGGLVGLGTRRDGGWLVVLAGLVLWRHRTNLRAWRRSLRAG